MDNHPAPRLIHTRFTPRDDALPRFDCHRTWVPLLLLLPNGDRAELSNDEGRTLVLRLWRLGVGRGSGEGVALSAAIADAFVDDFTVDVADRDLPALEQVLFRLAATMQLTPGLSSLRLLIGGTDDAAARAV
jgi:hypothetical protein